MQNPPYFLLKSLLPDHAGVCVRTMRPITHLVSHDLVIVGTLGLTHACIVTENVDKWILRNVLYAD